MSSWPISKVAVDASVSFGYTETHHTVPHPNFYTVPAQSYLDMADNSRPGTSAKV